MTPHLSLVTEAPHAFEPLYPLLQAGAPWALMGLMAATLVRPVTEAVRQGADAVRQGADAVSAGAKRSFAAAQVPVKATQAHFDRLLVRMRGDDGQ